mmetsp:Transcript_20055/g.40842  ORF Transcript_20055/g.40842 Transcript_20055/m.40842 type:complete len:102 (-) Transcript_20055:3284-3589(-)
MWMLLCSIALTHCYLLCRSLSFPVLLDTTTAPERTRCSHIPFDPVGATSIRCLPLEAANGPKASKRRKVDHDDVPDSDSQLDPIMDEVRRLAALLSNALFN